MCEIVILSIKFTKHIFFSDTPIDVFVPEIELEDGSVEDVLEVIFHENNIMRQSSLDLSNERTSYFKCQIRFYSKVHVSFSTHIAFTCGDIRYDFRPIDNRVLVYIMLQ